MNNNYKFAPDASTGTLSSDDTKKYISRFAFAVFALGVLSNVAAFLFSLGLGYLFKMLEIDSSSLGIWADIISNLLSLICIYAVGMPAFIAIAKPLPRVTPYREKMPTGKFIAGICVSFFFMMAGSYISNIFITFFSAVKGEALQNPVEDMVSDNSIWVTILFMVIIAPILEELLFRKLLCNKLLPLGEGYAIFISAAVFGAIHGNFFQFAYAFLLGALFALIYVKTGKLIYSTIYHMLINFFGAVVSPAVVYLVDTEKLEAMLEEMSKLEGTMQIDPSVLIGLFVLLAYETVLMTLAIIGLVFFWRASRNREIKLEAGILPPPKKGKYANVFLTVGTAALITFFAITFILSILPSAPQ